MTLQVYLVSILILLTGNATVQFKVVPKKKVVEGVRNEVLNLEWDFVDIPSGLKVASAILYFNETNIGNPDTKNIVSEWSFAKQMPSIISESNLFPGRFNVSYKPNTYKVTLTNLQYNDTGSFFLRVGIGLDTFRINASDSAVITISQINGGPEFLKGLESNYTFGSNVTPVINFTLRGGPAPNVTWQLHEDVAGNATRKQSDSYIYRYSIQLPKLTQETCGRQLVLKAIGYNTTERTTTVFVTDFIPEPVIIGGFFTFNSSECKGRRVQWHMLNTGCAVEYNIEFRDDKNVILGNKASNRSPVCDTDYGNATSVIMWATFNGFRGSDSEVETLKTTTTTTTAATLTTFTFTNRESTKIKGKNREDDNTTLIIVVVVVVLVLVIVIIAVAIWIKKKKKVGNGKSKKSQDDVIELKPPSYTDEGDYASVDAMPKKAAAENNPDQMLYAELGAGGGRKGPKSEPMESNYAQVKVDEMGYPARGPASDMSEPPQYPTSISRDRSRRHSPPPHYGGLDDDDGVIV